jgi:hypothetical protein
VERQPPSSEPRRQPASEDQFLDRKIWDQGRWLPVFRALLESIEKPIAIAFPLPQVEKTRHQFVTNAGLLYGGSVEVAKRRSKKATGFEVGKLEIDTLEVSG